MSEDDFFDSLAQEQTKEARKKTLDKYKERLGLGEGSQNARKWYERMESMRSLYEQVKM